MHEEKKQGWAVGQFIITISLISQLSPWKAQQAGGRPMRCWTPAWLSFYWAQRSRRTAPLIIVPRELGQGRAVFFCPPFPLFLCPLSLITSFSLLSPPLIPHSPSKYLVSAYYVLGTILALEYCKMKPLAYILMQCTSNFNVIWIIWDLAKMAELGSEGVGWGQAPALLMCSQVMLTLPVHILCVRF